MSGEYRYPYTIANIPKVKTFSWQINGIRSYTCLDKETRFTSVTYDT